MYIDTETSQLYTPDERALIDAEIDAYLQDQVSEPSMSLRWRTHRKRAAVLMMRKLDLADLENQKGNPHLASDIIRMKNIISAIEEYTR